MKFFKYVFLLLLTGIFLQVFSGFRLLKLLPTNKRNARQADCPVLDFSNEKIVNPPCNQSTGSITGITVTSSGTKINYTWRDNSNNVVAHSLDLRNIAAGYYSLEVSDNSGCGSSVFSLKILVENANAVRINAAPVSIKTSTCNNDGAIMGIDVSGATTIEWHNVQTGALVSTSSTSADLVNVPPGSYQLVAYNSTCQVTSQAFYVASELQVPTVVSYSISNPICGGEGSLTVTLNVKIGEPRLQFFFADSRGIHVADGLILGDNPNPILFVRNLDGGPYDLFVEDANNCKVLLGTYVVKEGNVEISKQESAIVNDRCDQHLGFVIPVINGGSPSSKDRMGKFTWTDINTKQVVGVNKVLSKVGAGTYALEYVDPGHCIARDTFTVINIAPPLIPPTAQGTTLCLPGVVNITVTNTHVDTSKIFKLYANIADSIPLETNSTGVFYRHIDETTDFYLTRSNGTCESDRTKVTEIVVVDIKIPNAFTPNNDGINDYWNIQGIEKFPGADISVFTRSGQLVFHSINYPAPFNGTYKGAPLPNGVYYYVMDVKQPVCYGKISGSLTIIR